MKKSTKKKIASRFGLFSTFSTHTRVYVVVLIVAFLVSAVGFIRLSFLLRPTVETPKTDMAKLPADVKKNLRQAKQAIGLPATIRVPILLYHYVEYVQDKKDTIRQSLDITPNVFESQVQTLREAGYSFMTAKDLAAVLDGKAFLPPKPILLTFDDGHWDLDTVVLPILEKYQVKATAYIISGFIGGSDFMTPQQLEDVIGSGLVEIGAHTVHHFALKGLPFSVATTEIAQSKADLENTYHIHVVSFAYPSGSFDEQAIQLVKQAGYATAVSTIPGVEQNQLNRYFLYRLRPGYRTGQDLLEYLGQETFRPY